VSHPASISPDPDRSSDSSQPHVSPSPSVAPEQSSASSSSESSGSTRSSESSDPPPHVSVEPSSASSSSSVDEKTFKVHFDGLNVQLYSADVELLINGKETEIVDYLDADTLLMKFIEEPSLVISAVNANPPGSDRLNLTEEWIEITNNGSVSINLYGWVINDLAGYSYDFPLGYALPPSGVVRIRTGIGQDTQTDLYWGRRSPVWNNTGDVIFITDGNGKIIVHHAYGNVS